jgi:hypothetical protein
MRRVSLEPSPEPQPVLALKHTEKTRRSRNTRASKNRRAAASEGVPFPRHRRPSSATVYQRMLWVARPSQGQGQGILQKSRSERTSCMSPSASAYLFIGTLYQSSSTAI